MEPETDEKGTSPAKKSAESEIVQSSKKPVEQKKQKESFVGEEEISPSKKVSEDTSQGFSPRRSSRTRKVTEKGKHIFEIFKTKITTREQIGSPNRDKLSENTEEARVTKKDVEGVKTRKGKATNDDVEGMEKTKKDAKEEETKPKKETKETETIGRHTRSKMKVVTNKVDITEKIEVKKIQKKGLQEEKRKKKEECKDDIASKVREEQETEHSTMTMIRSGTKIEVQPRKRRLVCEKKLQILFMIYVLECSFCCSIFMR